MCFSAGASFGAGIVLSVIGVASIKKAQSPSQIVFASIPLIFSVQQIAEGFLWLALSNPVYASMQQVTTYTFLFLARLNTTRSCLLMMMGLMILLMKN